MKIFKIIFLGGISFINLLIYTPTQASWWGELSDKDRAVIIIGSALLLNNTYQNSEIKHKENLKDIDTQIRREYETQRTIDEAHKKYSYQNQIEKIYIIENKVYNEEIKKTKQRFNNEIKNPIKEYIENPTLGEVIYSDEKTALIELYDGTRFILEKKYLK